jgi:hypothetical protein
MGRNTRRLFVAALVVLGAGVAGAQTTPTMATTTATTTTNASTPSTLAAGAVAPVEQIVSLARTVEPGAGSVTAFTVPAGHQLVVTDVLITNPSATPVCGAAVSPGGTPTSATTGTTLTGTTTGTVGSSAAATTPSTATSDTGSITSTGATTTTTTPGGSTVTTPATASTTTVESGTGTLCVPAQTSLSLSLTTGLEFAGGQTVVLANQPAVSATPTTTTTGTTATGPLFYHLRGFLTVPGV